MLCKGNEVTKPVDVTVEGDVVTLTLEEGDTFKEVPNKEVVVVEEKPVTVCTWFR